jgi:hypothetical protein
MRHSRFIGLGLIAVALAACGDVSSPAAPTHAPSLSVDPSQLPSQAQGHSRRFTESSPEVMELATAVYAAEDNATGQMVFGVDHPSANGQIRAIMARHGVPESGYRVVPAAPIRFMNSTLRTDHSSKVGGLQIHFGSYLCTLGFNVEHAGGRSFITNSHCTDSQGTNTGTEYYQPLQSVNGTVIAVEADDPGYGRGPGCSKGKKCRRSDASRALYQGGITVGMGSIAKPTGTNDGQLGVNGAFAITSQVDNTAQFSGTIHKVGRTTGWTSGTVASSCSTVNVSQSNIQLLCQTLVLNPSAIIVGGGDSGSPVFQTGSGSNVTLVGILWGGSADGHQFVFSPLKNVQEELGAVIATAGGSPPPGGDDDPPAEPPGCTPRGNSGKCK